ncbi:MAG: MFS transporter [Nitrososphaera sp.]
MESEDSRARKEESRHGGRDAGGHPDSARPPATSEKVPLSAWKTLAILSSIATMIMYTETMLVPSLPNIIKEFNLPYSVSPWILTTYLIVGAVMTPIVSSLAEMHGKKKILLSVMGIYFLGVLIGGFSQDLYVFILARGLQGVGMSMFPIAFSIIREQFPKSKLAIGQGIITSMFASGAIVGLVVGAAIASGSGWRMTFLSIIPITILLPFLVWRFTKIGEVHSDWAAAKFSPASRQGGAAEPPAASNFAAGHQGSDQRSGLAGKTGLGAPKPRRTLDIIGAGLLAIAISTFLITLTLIETTQTQTTGSTTISSSNNSAELAAFALACIVSVALFLRNEKRAANPLIDLGLLRNRVLLFSNILILILGFSMFMVFQTIPILAESPPPAGFGVNIIGAGQIQLPFALILLIFGPTSGFIVSRLGSIRPTVLGYAINAGGFFMLTAFHSQPWMVSAALATISTGISLGSVGLMNIILLATPFQKMVTSVGMTTVLRILGSAVGPAIAGVVMQLNLTTVAGHAGRYPSMGSYTIIFLAAALVSVLSVVMALSIRRHLIKGQTAAEASPRSDTA